MNLALDVIFAPLIYGALAVGIIVPLVILIAAVFIIRAVVRRKNREKAVAARLEEQNSVGKKAPWDPEIK